MKSVPIYHIRHWRCTTDGTGGLRYRPSLRNLPTRLLWTALCALLIGLIEWGYRDIFGARSLYEFRPDGVIDWAHLGVVGTLAAVAVLIPLSWLWNRVNISITRYGELEISSWYLLPRRRRWDVSALAPIRTLVMECFSYSEHGRVENHRWEWIVQVSIQGTHALPLGGGIGLSTAGMGPQFNVYREKHRPSLIGRAPEPVRELVKGLRGLTGLAAEAPQVVEGRRSGRRGRGVTHTLTHTVEHTQPVARYEQVFEGGEEIPDHIREQLRAMTGDSEIMTPEGIRRVVQHDIVVRDAEGNETTYNSVDDLPDDVRRRLGL